MRKNSYNYQFTGDFMYSKITNAANNEWQELVAEKTMDQAGYVYIYTATESNTNVDIYFDDFDIRVEQTHIVAGNDYYPFGLPIVERSYEKQDYRYDYQSLSRFYIGRQYSEKDDETGYNAFQPRQYACPDAKQYGNARIGRWISPDPYGQYASAYVGMGNNPVSGVDPDGGFSYVGATALGLVGAYAGGVISSGSWNPGDWEGKDFMWAGIGAGAGFLGGGLLGDALHSTTDHVYSGQANSWDRFTSIFGEGSIKGSRYIADAPSLGKLKFPKFEEYYEAVFYLAKESSQIYDKKKTYDLQFSRNRNNKNYQFEYSEFWGNTQQNIYRNKNKIWSVNRDWDRLVSPVFNKRGKYLVEHTQIFPSEPEPEFFGGKEVAFSSTPILEIKLTVRKLVHGRIGKTHTFGWKRISKF